MTGSNDVQVLWPYDEDHYETRKGLLERARKVCDDPGYGISSLQQLIGDLAREVQRLTDCLNDQKGWPRKLREAERGHNSPSVLGENQQSAQKED